MISGPNLQAPICCTVVTRNHLPYARVLMASVKEHWPAAVRFALVIDADRENLPAGEDFTLLTADEFCGAGFKKRAFLNGPGGLCALFKPRLVAGLLRRTGAPYAVYVDADTRFYQPPQALVRAAGRADFAFTPHTLAPAGPAEYPSDGDFARAGTYNAGLFVVANSSTGLACMDCWADGMWRDAWLDHRFAWDQIWLPLLRHYFPRTEVITDVGYNVAYWNLRERPLSASAAGQLRAGGEALVHFHFSFFDPQTPQNLVHRWGRTLPASDPVSRALCDDYARAYAAADHDGISASPYRYGVFRDGTPVTEHHREYYRTQIAPHGLDGDDPFDPAYAVKGFRGTRSLHALNSRAARVRRLAERMNLRFRNALRPGR